MREIKFRAFNKAERKMCRVVSIDFTGFITVRFPEFEHESDDYNDQMLIEEFEPLMQYTGLKDKNGKEIYEGDIVETVTASGNPFGTIDVVRYQDGGFKLVDDTDSLLPIYIGDKEVISIEIIGNIYENPELLEKSK